MNIKDDQEHDKSPNKSPVAYCLAYCIKALYQIENKFKQKIGFIYALLGSFFTVMIGLLLKMVPNLSPFQIIYFRSLLLVIFNYIVMRGYNISVYASNPRMNRMIFSRGLSGGIGVCFWFTSYILLPLSEATTLFQTAPVIIGILARFTLGEKYDLIQFITTIASFIGVLLVIQPKSLFGTDDKINNESSDMGNFLYLIGVSCALINAFIFSVSQILIRKIGSAINAMTTTHYFGFFGFIISSIMMMNFHVMTPTFYESMILLQIGIIGYIVQLCQTRALVFEKAGKISLINYSGIIMSFIIDVIFLDNMPNFKSIIGSILVCTSIFSIIYKNPN